MSLPVAAPGLVALAALIWGLTRIGAEDRVMWFGAWAAIVGLIGLIVLLAAPTMGYAQASMSVTTGGEGTAASPEVEQGTRSLLEDGAWPGLLRFGLIWLLLALVAPAGAWLHARRGLRSGRGLLWAGTATLLLLTVLGAFSLAPFVAPAALLALMSAAETEGRRPS